MTQNEAIEIIKQRQINGPRENDWELLEASEVMLEIVEQMLDVMDFNTKEQAKG